MSSQFPADPDGPNSPSPWAAPGRGDRPEEPRSGNAEPRAESQLDPNDPYRYGRPELDPNDPYRFGRPEPDPNDPYRFGVPQYGPPPGHQPFGPQPTPPFRPPDYPPPPYSQYPQPPARNGLAIAGFVLGVTGLVLAWIPVLGIVLGILGAIFAGVGLRTADRARTGRNLALGGLVCGVLATIACTVWSVYLFTQLSDCLQYTVNSPSYQLCIQNG